MLNRLIALVVLIVANGCASAAPDSTTSTPAPTATGTVFLTGEVWEGTEHGEWRNPAAAGFPGAVIEGDLVSTHDGMIRLTVASDGSVSGEGSGTQVAPAGPGDYITTISGTREDDAFRPLRMSFSPGGSADWVVPIRGRTAEGTFQSTAGTTTYTVTIKLKCVESCGEAAQPSSSPR